MRWAILAIGLVTAGASAAVGDDAATSSRIERINQAFLKHLSSLPADKALPVATVRDGWNATYKQTAPEGFVPDALAVLYPAYREALEAYDDGRPADVQRLLDGPRNSDDRYLAANAAYFYARAMIERGLFEEAEQYVASLADNREKIDDFTPHAPQLWFIQGFCEARNLRFAESEKTLAAIRERFPDAPESVQIGVRQMLLEIERRELGTLDEVATLMGYAADRLRTTDAGERVRKRQDEAVELLDKLIKEAEQREKNQGGGGKGGKKSGAPKPGQLPKNPAQESKAPDGSGEIGDLHGAPRAQPGESWGNLPPSERERIINTLRDRFPSRYRQLVEQYYRSLAEQK